MLALRGCTLHMRECSRAAQEFHQQNNAAVLGIREGTWLHVCTDDSHSVVDVVLHGPHGAVAFLKGQEPRVLDSSAEGGISVKFLIQ